MTVNTRTGSSRSPKDKPTEEFRRTGSSLGVLGSGMKSALSNKRGPKKEREPRGRFRLEDSFGEEIEDDNLYDFEDMPPKPRASKSTNSKKSKAVESKPKKKTQNKKSTSSTTKRGGAKVAKHPPLPEEEQGSVNRMGLTGRQIDIIAFVLVGIAVILAGSVWTPFGGPAGQAVSGAVASIFGVGSYLVPLLVAATGIALSVDRMPSSYGYMRYGVGGVLIALSTLGLIDTFAGHPDTMPGRQGSGGMIGVLMAQPMAHGFSNFVAVPILVLILFYGVLRTAGVTVRDVASVVGGEVDRRKAQLDEKLEERRAAKEVEEPTTKLRVRDEVRPRLRNTSYTRMDSTRAARDSMDGLRRAPAPRGYDDVATSGALSFNAEPAVDRAADQGRSLFDEDPSLADKRTEKIPSLFRANQPEPEQPVQPELDFEDQFEDQYEDDLLLDESAYEEELPEIYESPAAASALPAREALAQNMQMPAEPAEPVEAAEPEDFADDYADDYAADFADDFADEVFEAEPVEDPVEEPAQQTAGMNHFSTPAPPARFDSTYQLPDMSVLKHGAPPKRHSEANEQIVDAINAVLEEFGVNAQVTGYNRGPTVTCYIIQVGPGVKMSKITGLQTNFAYAVKTSNIRLLMPIPGHSAVGIEVPNDDRETVYLGDALSEPNFANDPDPLLVPIGKGVEGSFVTFALNKLPHMLVAGSTGSGKSAFVNSLLVSLLSRATPEQLRLILVDPKMVEFTPYEGIPHLLTPIITEPKRASDALMWLVEEMERRYLDMKAAGVRNIEGYNKKFDRGEIVAPPGSQREYKRFPYIVAIVDELADLMMTAPREIEDAIVRITQKARAAGIHLILATQRPSVNVVTGLIKSNIPSRVAFATASNQDSRVILDQNGAEKLLGMGDGLFIPQGQAETVRIQGAYVDDAEIHAIVEQTKSQVPEPDYIQIETKTETPEAEVEVQPESDDDVDMLCAAAELAAYSTTLSISNLQRKLRMGFSKAGRMMDQLEEFGVVGPAVGTKAREVIITEEDLPSIQWMMRGGKPDEAPGVAEAQASAPTQTAQPAQPAAPQGPTQAPNQNPEVRRVEANPNGGIF
ncbi:MAG: DNA translocase FtsK [Corynebacterium sp.]|nr:DNA translocase FtsK [Corynebacterium sp.]